MPIPKRPRAARVGPDPHAEPDGGAWVREFEVDTSDCQCPQRAAGLCVQSLGLPPRGGWYVHYDGRTGTLVLRKARHDPLSGAIVQTAVKFECVNSDGRTATWALKCAGPLHVENRYEAERDSRPPTSVR
ncbi:hypothetical protein ACFC1T_02310 [Kitasatospora sp. NPDC056076]|uniref:hypothetical protein n=1 Tax=Kitasatospora sp. NPDC056076 TaxID=3345703 RepID=UPI0035D911C3